MITPPISVGSSALSSFIRSAIPPTWAKRRSRRFSPIWRSEATAPPSTSSAQRPFAAARTASVQSIPSRRQHNALCTICLAESPIRAGNLSNIVRILPSKNVCMRCPSAVLEHIVQSVTWSLGGLNKGLHDSALFCACDKCCRFSILSEIQTVCSARRAGCAAEKLCRLRAGPATTPTNPTTTLLLPLETEQFSVVKTVVAVCRSRPCDLV